MNNSTIRHLNVDRFISVKDSVEDDENIIDKDFSLFVTNRSIIKPPNYSFKVKFQYGNALHNYYRDNADLLEDARFYYRLLAEFYTIKDFTEFIKLITEKT
eukprot:TRINITY_DN7626_c0_g1_i1.p1 TRINITY_DN7626_c0_g1~~TRINITY_DN7626_c0_g1_i1.p1  ORF type:complete len:101 (-),score=10.24 TRINITY_DN7626_c0_g1_i1:56-358(-)